MKKPLYALFLAFIFIFFSGILSSHLYAQTTRFEAEGAYGWVTPFGSYTGNWNDPVNVVAMSGGAGAGPSGSNDCSGGSARGRYTTLAGLGLPNGTYNFSFGFYDNNTTVYSSNIWAMIGPETKAGSIPVPPGDPGEMLLVNNFVHSGTTVRASFTSPEFTNITMSQTDAIFLIICAGSSSDVIWDYIDITPTYPNLNNPLVAPGQTFTINENNCTGAVVGTVSASDADMPAALDHRISYSITGGNTGSAFSIDPSTGKLSAVGILDYETRPSYTLSIQVSDNGTPARTSTSNVTVNVGNIIDVANNPPVMNNQTLPNINENSNFGTVVGTVAASDPDGNSLHYSIIAGNTGDVFMFNGNQFIVNGALDYETKNSYTLTVLAADNACPKQTKTASITVNLNNLTETSSGLCTSLTPQGNLITNGDFESAVNSSYSEYSFSSPTCAAGPGTWGVSLPISCRSSYRPATKNGVAADASGDPNGHYMLIDADDNTSAVWKSQTITVTGGVTYYFSAWISNINSSFRNPSWLNFLINGTVINGTTLIKANTDNHEWSQYYTTWTAPASPTTQSIVLSFRNVNDDGSGSGDDMGLDNLSFSGSCQFIDAFKTSQLPSSLEECDGSGVTLNSMVPPAATTFSWTRNETSIAGATGPTLTTGSGADAFGRYILCYTKSGCSIRDTVDILMCPLPVELVNFSAWKNDAVNSINWTTSSEKNNAYFMIERSSDGIEFTSVGQVNGNGNSSTLGSYTFTDEHPLPGNNYYRLKQVDFDGEFTYSKVNLVQQGQADVTIYPNPNHGSFSLMMTASEEAYQIDISDVEGRTVYATSVSEMTEKVDVTNLAKGMYIVRIFLEREVIVKKVLVY